MCYCDGIPPSPQSEDLGRVGVPVIWESFLWFYSSGGHFSPHPPISECLLPFPNALPICYL